MTSPAAPAAPLTAQVMRRLAFVQMFFHQSVDQTRQPEPLGVTGVLGLHDAAELFLQVAAERLNVTLPPFVPFLEYFRLIRNGASMRLLRWRERKASTTSASTSNTAAPCRAPRPPRMRARTCSGF
jgi:hypothetical protein